LTKRKKRGIVIQMDLARIIDHTILKPELPFGVYTEGVRSCVQYNFASFCVNPQFVHLVSNLLKNHPECQTVPCSVVSFPFGATTISSKLTETAQALTDGAKEIDFVINISAVKTSDWNKIKTEFKTLRDITEGRALIKCILEVGVLEDEEIKRACDIAAASKLDFVKTSTGFHVNKLEPKQTARYVKLMADQVKGSNTKVKASGWLRSLNDVNLVLEAGANRVGASNSIAIIEQFLKER
jgi:deoxyribose-phosphate aldolase